MSLGKNWMNIRNCVFFMNNSVQGVKLKISIKQLNSHTAFGNKKLLTAFSEVKMVISNQFDIDFTNAQQNTSPHLIYVTLYEHFRNTYVMLTEVHIRVFYLVPSSEINTYQKQIKVISITSEMI